MFRAEILPNECEFWTLSCKNVRILSLGKAIAYRFENTEWKVYKNDFQ